jgi:hypothetical protein
MERADSLFDRIIGNQKPIWYLLVVGIPLLILLVAVAVLDGELITIFQNGHWRVLILAPVIILYILIISPVLTRKGIEVFLTLRPLIQLSDEQFDQLVSQGNPLKPLHEMIVLLTGCLFGLLTTLPDILLNGFSWTALYWAVTTALMYGLLLWTIVVSFASTRITSRLYKQEIKFDVLDPSPFEPIGRQSLLLAIAFVGGITISLVLAYQPGSMGSVEFWLVYLVLVVVTVLIFFMNMLPTHRVLSSEKKQRLEPVKCHIHRLYHLLVEALDANRDTGSLSGEITALEKYEYRLQHARTWPYDTDMLRKLFFSVLIPLGTLLARLMLELFIR